MGKRFRRLGPILGLVLVLSLVIMPSEVQADDVTVVLTEATYIDYAPGEICENYDGSSWIGLCNGYDDGVFDWRMRGLVKIPDQSGGGNVTSVLFKLYYGDYFSEDAQGESIRVYRSTRDFVEDEVCWYEYESGHDWTTPGGDYTTANYAQATCPAEGNWITWNITEMANDAWIDDGDDLYVIVRFRYENEDNPDDVSIPWFRSDNASESLRPRIIVTYDEEVQTPEVDGDVADYGGHYVNYEITPTLYDWPSANVTAQVAPHGGAWSWESAVLEVSGDTVVVRNVTSLNKSTEYDIRAKLVYGSGTVYSTNDTFTTLAYDVPTWSAWVDDVETNQIGFGFGWTGNNDNKSVTSRLAWRRQGLATWNYEDWKDANNSTSKSWGKTVGELYDGRTYEYKAQFSISPYVWETDVQEVDTLDGVFLDAEISDVDVDFFQIEVDYEAQDVAEFDLQARQRLVGGALWHYSDTIEDLSGNGTQYFLFEDLRSMREYEWEVTATWDDGSATTSGEIFTSGIEITPELTNLDAEFVDPNVMRVSCDVDLNDADYLDPPIYCRYKPLSGSTWYTSNDETDVTDDGNWYVDMIVGDELDWETGYNFYMEIDYTAGTNQTDEDIFYTPEEPLSVVTLGVTGISGTSAYFRAYAQLAEFDGLYGFFEYWIAGSLEETYTRTDHLWLSDSGTFQIRVDDLIFGEDYQIQAMISDTAGIGPPLAYGGIYNFQAGYWTDEEPEPPSGYEIYGSIWDWFTETTPGHWTILLLGMTVLALIFLKQKEIAIISCLVVLGIGIVIGWVDTWIIVLLALGAGFTIYKFVTGRKGSTV